jgi:hypothetical protein
MSMVMIFAETRVANALNNTATTVLKAIIVPPASVIWRRCLQNSSQGQYSGLGPAGKR